jgi:type IV pilus assembly protein PilX
MSSANSHVHSGQRGVALITAMLLLLVLTIMGLSMFRSFGMQEKIAGNVREKQRALNAAESAQQYAEYWLSTGTVPATGTCTGKVPSSGSGQVCSPSAVDFTAMPWTAGVTFTQFTSGSVNTVSGTNTPTTGSYYAAPIYYITDLGANGNGELYQIDAVGYGGTPDAVAVVESTYVIAQGGSWSPNI